MTNKHLPLCLALLLLLSSITAQANAPTYKQILDHASRTAATHGIPVEMVKAVIKNESAWRTNATSKKGAMGLMQLIPATASRFGVQNAYDPIQNISGGVAYLAWLHRRFGGDWQKTLAGYNAGEGAVDKYNGIPPYNETKNYVAEVLRDFKMYQQWGGNQPALALVKPIPTQGTPALVRRLDKPFEFAVNSQTEPQGWEANVSVTTVKWTPPPNYYR